MDDVTFATVSGDPEAYLRLLKAAYRQAFGADTAVPEPPAGTDDPLGQVRLIEDALRERVEVTDGDFFALAKLRAENVQGRLLADTGIDPARVFLTAPAEGKAGEAGVVMELALE